ncbi:hypothetical protein BGZ93_000018 [Podila epicladia]|nr:hypothetical protein BGZ92_004473 [Podila epicladia]KAG0100831.1 hypothetical protein BGZ93_000018 [Podila epicladia]
MGFTKFNLSVTSTAPTPERLMIVLNPRLMADRGVVYQDYFPVAWHVLKYPVGAQPIRVTYDSQLTAILQEVSDDNVVNAASFKPADSSNNVFNIKAESGDIYYLDPQSKHEQKAAASVYNTLEKTFQVGLGDHSGRSYLTMALPGLNDLEFTFDAEFAIVPVGATVQDQSKMVTGTVHRPWFSFKLSDLTSPDVSFSFDGTSVNNVQGMPSITNHKANEDVFDPSSGVRREF